MDLPQPTPQPSHNPDSVASSLETASSSPTYQGTPHSSQTIASSFREVFDPTGINTIRRYEDTLVVTLKRKGTPNFGKSKSLMFEGERLEVGGYEFWTRRHEEGMIDLDEMVGDEVKKSRTVVVKNLIPGWSKTRLMQKVLEPAFLEIGIQRSEFPIKRIPSGQSPVFAFLNFDKVEDVDQVVERFGWNNVLGTLGVD
jgi:hypothetical protein